MAPSINYKESHNSNTSSAAKNNTLNKIAKSAGNVFPPIKMPVSSCSSSTTNGSKQRLFVLPSTADSSEEMAKKMLTNHMAANERRVTRVFSNKLPSLSSSAASLQSNRNSQNKFPKSPRDLLQGDRDPRDLSRPPSSTSGEVRLRSELQRSRLENEACERRISRLVRKVDELERLKAAQAQEELQGLIEENGLLRKQLERREKERSSSTEQQEAYLAKVKELTSKLESVTKESVTFRQRLCAHQAEIMSALGLAEKKEEWRKWGWERTQAYLKSEVQTLKAKWRYSERELRSLREEREAETLKSQTLLKQLETLEAERGQSNLIAREHESQLEYLSSEIKILRSFLTDERIGEAQTEIVTMRSSNKALSATVNELEKQLSASKGEEQRLQEDLGALKEKVEGSEAQYTQLAQRYNKSKQAWEEYRSLLLEQMGTWRGELLLLQQQKEDREREAKEAKEMLSVVLEEREALRKKIDFLEEQPHPQPHPPNPHGDPPSFSFSNSDLQKLSGSSLRKEEGPSTSNPASPPKEEKGRK